MLLMKCKMCGGDLDIQPGNTVAECLFCGSKQTVPNISDDKKAMLYDRAGYYRRSNEFDKAMAIYEQLIAEDNTDAEAHWSAVLCRYGIEYVEDPRTHKRVPTVNRVQYKSILDDRDYLSALDFADPAQKLIYTNEANIIDKIQKGILEVSRKEEPFDIFICYKESDESGRRTQDSVIAFDIYKELTKEGYRVFFARVTLEDKLGSAYEPYIFAALNSAKVMLVVGTNKDNFNAVWVKNEWSRYLTLMKEDSSRTLIPVYRDINPYDMPEEFSYLQAQDYGKIGAIQDLVYGINKLLKRKEEKVVQTTVINNSSVGDVNTLLERAFLFLEDREWDKADQYAEQVLNQEPKNAQAYLCKMMAELRCPKYDLLQGQEEPFDYNANYLKVVRFGNSDLVSQLEVCNDYIKNRNEERRLKREYDLAVSMMDSANSEKMFREAADRFSIISGYDDAESKKEYCLLRAEECRKDAIYKSACSIYNKTKVDDVEKAKSLFESIPGWKDADDYALKCQNKIGQIAQEEKIKKEKNEKLKKTIRRSVISIIILCVLGIVGYYTIILNWLIPEYKYNKGKSLINTGEINSGVEILYGLGDYKDAMEIVMRYPDQWLSQASDNGTIKIGQHNWIILAKEEGEMLLITEECVDKIPFDENKKNDWSNSSIKNWLNTDFYNNFSESEKNIIVCHEVNVARYFNNGVNLQKIYESTEILDKVFLLSEDEVDEYFEKDEDRIATYNGEKTEWWLRTSGLHNSERAMYVRTKGDVYFKGDGRNYDKGVRPAIWIKTQ